MSVEREERPVVPPWVGWLALRASLALLVLALLAMLLGMPGARGVAPWLVLVGVSGVLLLKGPWLQRWLVARWFG